MRKLRTWFDNTLGRRGALAVWAVVAILGLVVAGTLILLGLGSVPGNDPAVGDLPVGTQVFLSSLSRSLGIGAPETLLAGAVSLWFWFIGLLVMGTIFAWRTNALARTTAQVIAGRTPITDREHIVILGWSPIVPVLVRELALSTERAVRRTVAVLSPLDRRSSFERLDEMLKSAGMNKRLRVITRSGDPWNPIDLRRVNCGAARTVIIVDDVAKSAYSSMTLAFAATKQRQNDRQLCIVQVRNMEMKDIVDRSTDAHFIAVTSEDVILKAIAQSARQPGVTETLFDLLDFGGSELYTQRIEGATGLTYAELSSRLIGATAAGMVRRDGSTVVNPPPSSVIHDGDELLVVKQAADDIAVLDAPTDASFRADSRVTLTTVAEPHVGIVGPAGPALKVAENLRSFLSGDARISIYSADPVALPGVSESTEAVRVHPVTDYFGGLTGSLAEADLDQIVILADRSLDVSAAEIDAKTAVIVASARRALASLGRDVRFVTQVLDPASRGLIPVRASDDLIVSEEASAMMIVQAATDPTVFRVLVDLLDPSVGSAIHVLSLPQPGTDECPLRFRDLVALGLRSDVSVIGWRYFSPDSGWKVDLCVGRDEPIPDVEGFGVLAIAGSTKH
jgi:ion channel POLLUX/CASTOR